MGQKQWGGLASKLAATPLLLSHTIGVKPAHDENCFGIKLPYGKEKHKTEVMNDFITIAILLNFGTWPKAQIERYYDRDGIIRTF